MGGIIHSTVWQQPLHVKVVWICLLAMKNHEGMVYASVPGLAVAAGVSRAQCEEALELFKAPDHDSRCKENEGRRIADADGGWRVLNHFKYRDQKEESLREYQRQKQKEYRDRKKRLAVKPSNIGTTYAERKVADKEGCPL